MTICRAWLCQLVFMAVFAGLSALLVSCSRKDDGVRPVEIKFWYAWGGYEGKFLVSLVGEFNAAHPHIKVQPSFFNIGDKLLASIAGGVPPDVATVWDFMLVTMGESGCFMPLEDKLNEAGIGRDSYLPNIWDYGLYGAHKWGVPTTLNCTAIYANNPLVRAAGLDPAKPPRTAAELAEWSKRLTLRDGHGNLKQLGFAPVTTPIWIWNFGGDIFDPATRRFTLDRPENIRALSLMAEMYGGIGYDNFRRFSAGFGKLDSPQNPLFVNKQALREDGQWLIQMISKYAPGLDYSVFAFPPAKEGGQSCTQIGGSFWSIPQGCRHPGEAWEFLLWLIAPPQSARFCAELRNIPPMRASIEQPEFAGTRSDPNFEFFVQLVAAGKARPLAATPVGQQFDEALGQAMEPVLGGKVSANDFLRNLNHTMNEELDRATKLIGIE
ncbi:MAG: ABC transporter substrate-binding protein [bacterium]